MGLKEASDVTRLGKKFTEQDAKAGSNNPKVGRITAARKAGIVRAADRK